jgi:hypothetical protein
MTPRSTRFPVDRPGGISSSRERGGDSCWWCAWARGNVRSRVMASICAPVLLRAAMRAIAIFWASWLAALWTKSGGGCVVRFAHSPPPGPRWKLTIRLVLVAVASLRSTPPSPNQCCPGISSSRNTSQESTPLLHIIRNRAIPPSDSDPGVLTKPLSTGSPIFTGPNEPSVKV